MQYQTFQVTIDELEEVLHVAKLRKKWDDSLSDTILFEIHPDKKSKTHLGSDNFRSYIKSGYAECNSHFIHSYTNTNR